MAAVRIETVDRIVSATIMRPSSLNAIDEEVLAGLERARRQVDEDADARALVITGAGERAFCVGLDLDLLERGFTDLAYFRDVLDRLNAVLFGLEALEVPVVAAVNGLTRAGGFELLLACDLVVVVEEARIGDGHLEAGVVPGGGGSQRAPRRLGGQRARELLLTGRWLSGHEAVEAGLALRAVPRAGLVDAVETLVAPMRSRSRSAMGVVKHLMRDGAALPLREAVRLETERFVSYLATSPEPHEGFRASRRAVRG